MSEAETIAVTTCDDICGFRQGSFFAVSATKAAINYAWIQSALVYGWRLGIVSEWLLVWCNSFEVICAMPL